MKTRTSKTPAAQAKANSPFFGGQGSFFIQRKAETDSKGNYTGNYIFNPGHDGLDAGFFNKVKKDVRAGVLDDAGIRALRADAIDRNGTVEHAELLLMAAMRNSVNVKRMQGHTTGSLIIPMSDIQQTDEDYLTNFGVEQDPIDTTAYTLRILASLFGLSKEKATDIASELDTRATDLIHKYAGKQFSDQADKLIVYAESDPFVPWDELIDAMLNGAADSTPGDRIMAGTVYAIARKAGNSQAPRIRSGALKIDALIPSVFKRIVGDSGAYYQYTADADVLKADTLYIKTDLDIFKLSAQALVIHELTHAADDAAAAGTTTKQADSLTLETHAYKEQGRYTMDQVLATPAATGLVDQAADYTSGSTLYYWSMVAAAKDDVSKYETVLVTINTHKPMKKTAADVKKDLSTSAADLDKKVRTELVNYRTASGTSSYSAGTTSIGGPAGHYFHP
jgi:hypothetical protein